MHPNSSIIRLPWSVQRRIDAAAGAFLNPPKGAAIDFSRPAGEEALLAPDSVSWRIFKNPVSLLIGGIAAVILELAEPCVRTGVWEHSSFRKDPVGRMRRTGLAAMVTVYGARSVAIPMIAGVVRMHAKVAGQTPAGTVYSAGDARLLAWVQATATFGISQAYHRYVDPLGPMDFDALYREGAPVAQLYGTQGAPHSDAQRRALFDCMQGRLEPSPIISQFLQIVRCTPAFPAPLRWMQRMLVRAAVDLVPDAVRQRLGLLEQDGLRPHERWVVRRAGSAANRIVLAPSPASQACLRLGLPVTHLYG
jgi:uncharacterized protein (DUF2236 family)